jgi:hypothetical protein
MHTYTLTHTHTHTHSLSLSLSLPLLAGHCDEMMFVMFDSHVLKCHRQLQFMQFLWKKNVWTPSWNFCSVTGGHVTVHNYSSSSLHSTPWVLFPQSALQKQTEQSKALLSLSSLHCFLQSMKVHGWEHYQISACAHSILFTLISTISSPSGFSNNFEDEECQKSKEKISSSQHQYKWNGLFM